MLPGVEHHPRIADDHLFDLLRVLPAVSIEGPRAVGKTWTASRLANTVYALDDAEVFADVRQLRLTGGRRVVVASAKVLLWLLQALMRVT